MSKPNIPMEEGIKDFFQGIGSTVDGWAAPKAPGVRDTANNTSEWRQGADKALKGYGKFHDDNVIDSRSIVSRAQNSICQFPVYMTQSIRVNEAHIIAKAFERVYATFVQTVMSQNPMIDHNEVNDLAFLKNFHNNIQESGQYWIEQVSDNGDLNLPSLLNEFYQPIDEFDTVMQESMYKKIQISESMQAVFRVVPCVDKDLIIEYNMSNGDMMQGLKYLSEAIDTTRAYDGIVSPSEMDKALDDYNKAHPGNEITAETMLNSIKRASDAFKVKDSHGNMVPIKYDKVNGNDVFYRGDKKSTVRTTLNDLDAPKMLRDADIKKINGMLPYTMEVQFRVRKSDGGFENVKYIIGVKSLLHLINPNDLSEDLREILSGKEKNLQKVRYKTGEISFANYLFNLKGLKSDASKHINSDKRWLNTLKRLGEYEALHGTLLKKPAQLAGGNVPAPIGTLVLTQADVLKINDDTNIDLSTVAEAKRLARALFLIAIVIVDSTGGTMRVLMTDTDSDWGVQSLSSLEIETNKTDNNGLAKELNRMINR